MNIYLREMKAHLKSLIIWAVIMLFLVMAGIGKYTAAAQTGINMFNDMIKEMPKSMQGLFGVGVFDLSKLVDYFGVLFLYLALVLTIHAVMLGNGIISKEERDKTAEFLLVKPVSRGKIFTVKLLSAFTGIVIMNLVTTVTSYAMFVAYAEGETFGVPLIQIMAALFALQVIFTALGALTAAAIGKHKLSASLSSGILLMMFFLSVIIDISGRMKALGYLTFFKYFDPKDFLKGDYNMLFPLLTVVLTGFFLFGALFLYRKRDMKL